MLHRSFAATALVLLANAPALAEGLYIGAGVGITQLEDDDDDFGISLDGDTLGWRVFAGYPISEYFAVEGSYVDSGDVDGTISLASIDGGAVANFEAEFSAVTLAIVGTLPLSDSAGLFGKLGYFDGELEANAYSAAIDQDETGVTVGGGVKFDIGRNFAMRGELDWYDTDLDTVWSATVSLQYGFGDG